MIWVFIHIQRYTVHGDFLADVSRDEVRIITFLFQIIILCLYRLIAEIKRLAYVSLDHLVIRIERKEKNGARQLGLKVSRADIENALTLK